MLLSFFFFFCFFNVMTFVLDHFNLQILVPAPFLSRLQLHLRALRDQFLHVHCIMIKDLSLGCGKLVLMHGFLLVLGRLLMALMVQLRTMGIFIVLFVMIMVILRYLMCPISIVSFLWKILCPERATLLIF